MPGTDSIYDAITNAAWGVLEQVGCVLFESRLYLLDAGIHQTDGANDHGRNRFVAVGDRPHDCCIGRVFPDVAFMYGDAG